MEKRRKSVGKLTKLNPTITKTIRMPNFDTINDTARLITSEYSVNWNVNHSLTKQQLENILNNEITNKVKEKLEIEEKNLTAWVYDKTFLDGNIEKMGLNWGKLVLP